MASQPPNAATTRAPQQTLDERLAGDIDSRMAATAIVPLFPQAVMKVMTPHLDALDRLRTSPKFAELCGRHAGLALFDALDRGYYPAASLQDSEAAGLPAGGRPTLEQWAIAAARRAQLARRMGLPPQAVFRVMVDEASVLEDLYGHPALDALCRRFPDLGHLADLTQFMAE